MYQFALVFLLNLCHATYVPKTGKSYRLSTVALSAKDALQSIGLVFGLGMVLLGVYKYTEYRANPLGNPLSRSVSLVIAGAALVGAYYLPVPEVKPF